MLWDGASFIAMSNHTMYKSWVEQYQILQFHLWHKMCRKLSLTAIYACHGLPIYIILYFLWQNPTHTHLEIVTEAPSIPMVEVQISCVFANFHALLCDFSRTSQTKTNLMTSRSNFFLSFLRVNGLFGTFYGPRSSAVVNCSIPTCMFVSSS